MIKFLLNSKDITAYIKSLSFENSIDSLSTTVNFTVPFFENTEFLVNVVVGDKIEIVDDINIFKGIVIETSQSENNLSCKSMDIAFYLNKNKIIKQVRNVTGSKAINSICSELGISVSIKGLNTVINKVYKNQTVADIINDIIKQDTQQTEKEYYIYSLNNTVYIDYLGSNKVDLEFEIENKYILKNEELVLKKTITHNIEELKNSIIVVSNDSKSVLKLASAENKSSISRYGRLQEVVELESSQIKQAKKVADNVLKLSDSINEELSIEIISKKYFFSGMYILLNNKKYLIKSMSLNYQKNRFQGSLNLKEIK